MVFENRKYTEDAIIKQASLIELHSKDGSALDAGCSCIEGKHLFAMEGLSEEAEGFAVSTKEKEFYDKMAEFSRKARLEIEGGGFNFPTNPTGRAYEPHGLTECEKTHPKIKHKISRCIMKVEKREGCTPPYTDCPVNPVAVCRASVKCP